MNFKFKYQSRKYILNGLGLFFSFTLLLYVYIKIKSQMLQDYPGWLSKGFEKKEILPLYYWFLLTIPVDLGIRKLIQMESRPESN